MIDQVTGLERSFTCLAFFSCAIWFIIFHVVHFLFMLAVGWDHAASCVWEYSGSRSTKLRRYLPTSSTKCLCCSLWCCWRWWENSTLVILFAWFSDGLYFDETLRRGWSSLWKELLAFVDNPETYGFWFIGCFTTGHKLTLCCTFQQVISRFWSNFMERWGHWRVSQGMIVRLLMLIQYGLQIQGSWIQTQVKVKR